MQFEELIADLSCKSVSYEYMAGLRWAPFEVFSNNLSSGKHEAAQLDVLGLVDHTHVAEKCPTA